MSAPSDTEVPLTERELKREVLARADRPTVHARLPNGERVTIVCTSMAELGELLARPQQQEITP